MAEVVITDLALLHIRAMTATMPWVQPVLAVTWWKGGVDNFRDPQGAAIWKTIDPPEWTASVSDWHEAVSEAEIERLPLFADSRFRVYRDKRADEAPGRLVITLTEEGLRVAHES